jgi:peptidoglycan hydrolase-like protein with peptidoglycan-binding domain
MRRRLPIAAAVAAALALLAVAVAVVGGAGGEAPAGSAANRTGSARVERRTLAERLTANGTIGYSGEATVLARLAGTVTALPRVGEVIRRGESLYSIEAEPVILMYGEMPAYRDLAEGVSDGEDVRQLEENLAALGYGPGNVDAEFTAATAAAVRAWQEDNGLEATGTVELGRVAFLPGARRITAIEATLGEAIGSSGGGGGSSGTLASYRQPSLGEGEEAAGGGGGGKGGKPDGEGGPKGGRGTEGRAGEPQAPDPEPESETPATGGEDAGASGGGSVSVPMLKATSTRRIVSVELEANERSAAHRGQKVLVVLPGGREVHGRVQRITAVESSGEEGPGSESEAAVEVTVAVRGKGRIPALDGASVNVLFTQRVRKNVLAVPVTALLAIGGNRFAVIVEEGTGRRRIVVEPGLAADGYVEVKGKGLRPGTRVETAE